MAWGVGGKGLFRLWEVTWSLKNLWRTKTKSWKHSSEMWTAQGLLPWLGIVISKAEASLSLLPVLDSSEEVEDRVWMVKEDWTVEQFLEVAVHFLMYLVYFVTNSCLLYVKLLFSFMFFLKYWDLYSESFKHVAVPITWGPQVGVP